MNKIIPVQWFTTNRPVTREQLAAMKKCEKCGFSYDATMPCRCPQKVRA